MPSVNEQYPGKYTAFVQYPTENSSPHVDGPQRT